MEIHTDPNQYGIIMLHNCITLDIDTPNKQIILYALQKIAKYGYRYNVNVRRSSSGKGIHIIAWSKTGLTKNELLALRYIAGDDPIRVLLDSQADRVGQVLFTNKKVYYRDIKEITDTDIS